MSLTAQKPWLWLSRLAWQVSKCSQNFSWAAKTPQPISNLRTLFSQDNRRVEQKTMFDPGIEPGTLSEICVHVVNDT